MLQLLFLLLISIIQYKYKSWTKLHGKCGSTGAIHGIGNVFMIDFSQHRSCHEWRGKRLGQLATVSNDNLFGGFTTLGTKALNFFHDIHSFLYIPKNNMLSI